MHPFSHCTSPRIGQGMVCWPATKPPRRGCAFFCWKEERIFNIIIFVVIIIIICIWIVMTTLVIVIIKIGMHYKTFETQLGYDFIIVESCLYLFKWGMLSVRQEKNMYCLVFDLSCCFIFFYYHCSRKLIPSNTSSCLPSFCGFFLFSLYISRVAYKILIGILPCYF